jgi:hypothetical protein
LLADVPEVALDDDYESKDKFIMGKMELGILTKLNKAGLPALINSSNLGGGMASRENLEDAEEELLIVKEEEPEQVEE